jgi:hypothetical protein
MRLLLFSLGLCLSLTGSATELWRVRGTQVLPGPESQGQLRLIPLQLFIEAGSPWDSPSILSYTIQKTSRIIQQCNLALGEVSVTTIELTPAGTAALNDQNPYQGPSVRGFAQAVKDLPKPLGFLIDQQSGPFDMAKAFTRRSTDIFVRSHGESMLPLNGTFYISSRWVDNRFVPNGTESYNTLAHEVVHLLGNIDHVEENDNLMSNRRKGGKLNAAQCAAMQRHPH